VDTEHGYLHDARNLSIIYETLPRDSRRIDARRKEIAADLKVLAGGKRSGLTASQQRLLDLWGGASNERLREASENVRWQLGQSDRYRQGLVRSGAYREHIERVARAKGLPVELAALPHVESSFHPGAVSSVAASGMWQFMRETAQRFMRVDLLVDERLDPYRATYAAMDMLAADYRVLGSWPLALTAYNHGVNGIARAVRETGTNDIGRIIADYRGSRFGFASRNFYPQFIAALQIDRNAEKYFGKIDFDPYPDFAEYEMTAYVDANVIASTLGVDMGDLKRANPALLQQVWTGNKRIPKGYVLKVDRSTLRRDFIASINAIPRSELHPEQIPDLSYTVAKGDTLSGIAGRYNTSIAELVAINQLRDRNSLRIGQKLVLPQRGGVVPTLIVNDSGPQSIPGSLTYTVRRGDTLTAISQRFGVNTATLMSLNGIRDRNMLQPGQVLKLAADGSAASIASAPAPSVPVSDTSAPAADALAVAADSAAARQADAEQADNVLAADPADYSVASDNTIEILTDETLGHFAEWLGMDSAALRRLNNLRANATVRVGDRLKVEFSKVGKDAFETTRKGYHSRIQTQYFASYRIRDTENYSIRQNELVGELARKRAVPMWLFRQYNPNLGDGSRVRAGDVIVFPVVEKVTN
ncbi:MAG: LysM peptidoglycan-binding domain-containing protein, partial [Pseudomonadota bacterium]|nr:LysM peptidoglycan-binding domain-containing protein [Pseudomonadota bacterium]